MKAKGKVFKFGDNIDTDVIIPARYLSLSDPEELAKHCMEDMDPSFAQKARPGDIIVAASNFGCGSSREHAALAIKASGISCIIARSFARIFYRNAINIGLSILESEEAAKNVEGGDKLEVNFCTGNINNLTKSQTYRAKPFPEFIQEIMKADGLINYINNNLKKIQLSKGDKHAF